MHIHKHKILTVAKQTAKQPNLIPRLIFQLYGIKFLNIPLPQRGSVCVCVCVCESENEPERERGEGDRKGERGREGGEGESRERTLGALNGNMST